MLILGLFSLLFYAVYCSEKWKQTQINITLFAGGQMAFLGDLLTRFRITLHLAPLTMSEIILTDQGNFPHS